MPCAVMQIVIENQGQPPTEVPTGTQGEVSRLQRDENICLKPVRNWANCFFTEHTLDSTMNYNYFFN